MADDLYSDSGDEVSGRAPSGEGEGNEEDYGETALLPIGFFPDGPPEPGDKCSVKVVRVHDDQVEVEYSHDEDDAEAEAKEHGMEQPQGNELME